MKDTQTLHWRISSMRGSDAAEEKIPAIARRSGSVPDKSFFITGKHSMQAARSARRAQHGFTLIELMIVIAIVGVLAMVAVPQYRDYLIRAKVVEGLDLAAPAKMAVSEMIAAKGSTAFDRRMTGYSFTPSDKLKTVRDIAIGDGGIITITFGEIGGDGNDKTLILAPSVNASAIFWTCHAAGAAIHPGSLPAQYAPENCRS
jgi:type IV pilus assembly protein PilA